MEENKDCTVTVTAKNGKIRGFLADVLAGFGMGVAFIIPGFSGGSVAAILGIYEKLIGAIADIFRDFKRSVLTLAPIFIGLVLGAVSLLYPLGWALSKFPLPTVSLFVGLALGGLSSVTGKITSSPSVGNFYAFALPFILAHALSFMPTGADVDLFSLNIGGYLILLLIGVVASAALVVPGISGSMILLILGFYNPIISIITEHFLKGEDMLVSFLVLLSTGLGIVVGFIGISVIMKALLAKYPRGTYMAILGFILGSIPTVFVSTAKDADMTITTLPTEVWHWVACVCLLALGIALSLSLSIWGKKRAKGSTDEAK